MGVTAGNDDRPADNEVIFNARLAETGEGPFMRKCGPGSTSCFAFRSPLEAAPALRALATHASVVGNIANNHARDAGPSAWSRPRE